jgi:hypothetical protein
VRIEVGDDEKREVASMVAGAKDSCNPLNWIRASRNEKRQEEE